jgi:purine-nucleoside phosphorylase
MRSEGGDGKSPRPPSGALVGANAPCLGPPEDVARVAFGCRPEEVAGDVILSPFVSLSAFERHLDEGFLRLRPTFFYRGVAGTYRGRPVTVLLTGVGPTRVGDCLGFLSLTPARRVLFAGAVGSLRPEHAIGDFFVPTEAADGEGYTRYRTASFRDVAAAAPRIPCRTTLGAAAADFLRERGRTPRWGAVFTVGSIVVESAENLRTLAELRFDAVEMELSAFFSGAAYHGLEAAAFTYVSDLPLGSSLWQAKSPTEAEALRAAYRSLPALCLEFLAESGAARGG